MLIFLRALQVNMDLLHAVWDDTAARVHPLIPALLDDSL